MYCPGCGKQTADESRFCASCGRELAKPGPYRHASEPPTHARQPYIPNYLVQAILVTIFCCLPLGIVSIVYAAQVNGKAAAGLLTDVVKIV